VSEATKPEDLAAAFREYQTAKEGWETAARQEAAARGQTTTMLNRVNNAQKALSKLIEAEMKAAPMDSDWGRNRRTGMLEVRS
jgi:hypothetical protein